MRQRKVVGISFPKDVLERIESERGNIPRSRYIVDILRRFWGLPEDEMAPS